MGHWTPAFRLPFRPLVAGLALILSLHPNSLRACAACYGQSDSPMAVGMNWGIFSLLGVVVVVLGGIAAFFVYLARRSAALAEPVTEPVLASTSAAFPQRRTTPVLGRSDLCRKWGLGVLQRLGRVGHCCARGQAHSGPLSFVGSTRKITPESTL